jgi:hypothetical protein
MNLAKDFGKLYVLNARIRIQDVNRFDLPPQHRAMKKNHFVYDKVSAKTLEKPGSR